MTHGFGRLVWGFNVWSVIVNIFVRNERDARHIIVEMIPGKLEKLVDRLCCVLRWKHDSIKTEAWCAILHVKRGELSAPGHTVA